MVSVAGIPEKIRQDIAIYLGPDEKILKAISPDSGKIAGEVWLLLTSNSIFFHTCEKGKEPVVALIGRNEIKEIDYFQKPAEIVLTFVPSRNPGNTTKLTFPIGKKSELEDFCEDLADLIDFRMETKAGVKVYPRPEESKSRSQKAPESKSPAKVATEKSEKGNTVLSTGAAKADESDKSGKSTKSQGTVEKPSIIEKKSSTQSSKPAPELKIVAAPGKIEKTGSAEPKENDAAPTARYIVVATLVSVLVAFIWYQFFKMISAGRQNR